MAVVRSYSPHLGAMSMEQDTNTPGAMRFTISATRRSCAGLRKDHRKQIAMASQPSASSSRIAVSASTSFSGTITSPKQSMRSEIPLIRRLGTIGSGFWLSGKCTTLAMSREFTPREPRMMWMASSWPRVVMSPTFAPLRWISAFVPTVVPWVRTRICPQKSANSSSSRSAATRMAFSMPSAKLPGVDEDLVAVIAPFWSMTTQSVNVPPMSTPTRYGPIGLLPMLICAWRRSLRTVGRTRPIPIRYSRDAGMRWSRHRSRARSAARPGRAGAVSGLPPRVSGRAAAGA